MAKPRILIVEDDPTSFKAFSSYINALSWNAYEIGWETRADHALRSAFGNIPALIIIDVVLGKNTLGGLGLAHTLRLNPATQDIPIIITSADLHDEAAEEAGRIANFCFQKATKFSRLLAEIRRLIGDGEPDPKPNPADQASSTP